MLHVVIRRPIFQRRHSCGPTLTRTDWRDPGLYSRGFVCTLMGPRPEVIVVKISLSFRNVEVQHLRDTKLTGAKYLQL